MLDRPRSIRTSVRWFPSIIVTVTVLISWSILNMMIGGCFKRSSVDNAAKARQVRLTGIVTLADIVGGPQADPEVYRGEHRWVRRKGFSNGADVEQAIAAMREHLVAELGRTHRPFIDANLIR